MVNRNLIRELELGDELTQELELAMAGAEAGEYSVGASTLAVNAVLMGKVLRVDDEFVLVDVGYKSEGHIPRNEWDDGEPAPQVGDTVKVGVRIREGNKERVQPYEGVVIAKRHGGLNATITVRRIFQGVGVERVFMLHSPQVASVKVERRGKVRRAKLFYLRDRVGKATRVKQRFDR